MFLYSAVSSPLKKVYYVQVVGIILLSGSFVHWKTHVCVGVILLSFYVILILSNGVYRCQCSLFISRWVLWYLLQSSDILGNMLMPCWASVHVHCSISTRCCQYCIFPPIIYPQLRCCIKCRLLWHSTSLLCHKDNNNYRMIIELETVTFYWLKCNSRCVARDVRDTLTEDDCLTCKFQLIPQAI